MKPKNKKKPSGKEAVANCLAELLRSFLENTKNGTILPFSDSEYKSGTRIRKSKKVPEEFSDLTPFFDTDQIWKIRNELGGKLEIRLRLGHDESPPELLEKM